MYVYVITNTVNDKAYVGQTCNSPRRRWSEHVRNAIKTKKGSALGSAIRKYGKSAFNMVVIGEVSTRERLNDLEKLWITLLESHGPRGYNLTIGGEGSNGRIPWNLGLKGAQRAWNKGIPNPSFANVSRAYSTGRTPWNKGITGRKPWNIIGVPVPQERRDRISAKLKGKNFANPEARRQAQIKRYADPKQREIRSQLSLQQWAKRKAANE